MTVNNHTNVRAKPSGDSLLPIRNTGLTGDYRSSGALRPRSCLRVTLIFQPDGPLWSRIAMAIKPIPRVRIRLTRYSSRPTARRHN